MPVKQTGGLQPGFGRRNPSYQPVLSDSGLVKAAESGATVTITRRGREGARLVPIEPEPPKPVSELAAFRAAIVAYGIPLSGAAIEARKGTRY